MYKNKKKFHIKKSDYLRVLISETLPIEVPIIFSNEGFYDFLKEKEKIDNQILTDIINYLVQDSEKKTKYTIPFSYNILKGDNEYRHLSLIHPIAQWKIKELYEKYENIILYFCQKSPASIRCPQKIASFFYRKIIEDNKYKLNSDITLTHKDDYIKYITSFFSYKGYVRLYHFFESKNFLELEKKFSIFWSLDVAKCFPSIYTHSFSWALKDKEYIKSNLQKTQFCDEFDRVMQFANYNETNGIVIGPEISRIFAEMIFQKIDCNVINILEKKCKYQFYKDYYFCRYVDDIHIFAPNNSIAKEIYDCYSSALLDFKLYLNTAKLKKYNRPFITTKTTLIEEVKKATNIFLEKIFDTISQNNKKREIIDAWSLSNSYLKTIKSICNIRGVSYNEISAYVIAIFTKKIENKIIMSIKKNCTNKEEKLYYDVLVILLEIIFFFYIVHPSINYKISNTLILLINRLKKDLLPSYKEALYEFIYKFGEDFLNTYNNPLVIDNFLSLEYINILICLGELGENYLIEEQKLRDVFLKEGNCPSYFNLMALMFYIKNHEKYDGIRDIIIKEIDFIIGNNNDREFDPQKNTEQCLLLLDSLACPYIFENKKIELIKLFYEKITKKEPNKKEIANFLEKMNKRKWFFDWENINLLNLLKKKKNLSANY